MPPVTVLVPVVVGEGACEAMARGEHVLSFPARAVKSVTHQVFLKRAGTGSGTVTLAGEIHQAVEYETEAHLLATDTFRFPFSCCLDFPDALPGDAVQILRAGVEVAAERRRGGWPFRRLHHELCAHIRVSVTRLARVRVEAMAVTPVPVAGPPAPLTPDS